MFPFRTDLAMEARALHGPDLPGVSCQEEDEGGLRVTRVRVLTQEAEDKLQKARGAYVTLESDDLRRSDPERLPELAGAIARELSQLLPPLPKDRAVLVVGLGNRYMTPDALGPRTAERMLVTRHMRGMPHMQAMREVCAVTPGVAGVTGIDALEVLMGLCREVKPCAVIAVDALAARDVRRILTTVQIADTGIAPGSGVGNARAGLTRESLGVPVIAVGVPMVVHATTIAHQALVSLLSALRGAASPGGDVHGMLTAFSEEDLHQLVRETADETLGELVVAPRDVDEAVVSAAAALALGINMALQPDLSAQDILALTN